jgi:uncharacterized YigZ family protein
MSETLANEACFELEARKSRFLVHAAPVETPPDALAFLERIALRDATHNCWAYRIGAAYRFADDGEPAGTAGRPILAAIDGQGLDRVMVVVTRWFGGIKLGAGGLVRAYGGSAAECLRRASRRTLVTLVEAELCCGFEHAGAVHGVLAAHAAHKLGEGYGADGLQRRLSLPATQFEPLAVAVRDATRGRATLQRIG